MLPPQISLLVATDTTRRFCTFGGSIPWCHHAGRRLLSRQVRGQPLVVGRRTFEQLPRAFPGARWVVLSQTIPIDTFGVWTIRNAREALLAFRNALEIFVLGGVSVFDMFLPLASTIYWLEVRQPSALDARKFPALDKEVWEPRVVAESSRYVLRKHTRAYF